jgi:hypothetical protein
MSDGLYSGDHEFTFTELRWYERILPVLLALKSEIPSFLASLVALWGVSELVMVAADNRISIQSIAYPVLLVAITVSLYRGIAKYNSYVPDSLLSAGKTSQSIFRQQRCGWQFALASEMLSDEINRTDKVLYKLRRGVQFLEPMYMKEEEYVDWLREQPELLLRLVRAAAYSCTNELPRILSNTKSETDIEKLKQGVEGLLSLYKSIETFERRCHQVMPSEKYEDIHTMILDWANPIKDGIHEFAGILAGLSRIDRDAIKLGEVPNTTFRIKFANPSNIDDFIVKVDEIVLGQ